MNKPYSLLILIILMPNLFAKTPSYTFGISLGKLHANDTPQMLINNYKPLTQWLEKKLNWQIEIKGYKTYKELVENLTTNNYAFAYTKIFAYQKAKLINPSIYPIATIVTKNTAGTIQTRYQSAIITLKANKKITNLASLNGKIFGFGSRYSASGFVYPEQFLIKHKINYQKNFGQVVFYQHGHDLLQALLKHHIDAGACWKSELDYLPKKDRAQIRIMATIPDIPNPMYAATNQLSKKQRANLGKALISAPKKLFKKLDYLYLTKTPDGFYDHLPGDQ
jgi:phosphate/phosphite/phosphonate ABC transporter binding protein